MYFHEGLLPEKVKEQPVREMWQTRVPRLFHESKIVFTRSPRCVRLAVVICHGG